MVFGYLRFGLQVSIILHNDKSNITTAAQNPIVYSKITAAFITALFDSSANIGAHFLKIAAQAVVEINTANIF